MTEQERLVVVDKINRYLQLQKDRKQKRERVEELSKINIVKEYIDNLSEIQKLNKLLDGQDTKEDAISLSFRQRFNNKCCHDIWIYMASYSYWYCEIDEHWYESVVSNEFDDDFDYNCYCCLGCDKTVEVQDWEDFEATHFVLKNYSDTKYDYYKKLYYQLLYTNTVNDAKRIIIEMFKDNLVKTLETEYDNKKREVLRSCEMKYNKVLCKISEI